ncbi:MAG: Uma2 family endonuclease [Gemmataceae bacterium]
MSTQTPKLLTAEEFAKAHGGEYVELIDGEVKELPVPKTPHGCVANLVAYYLTQHILQNDLGRVASNDTFVLVRRNPDRVRGADVAFWSYARVPKEAILPDIIGPPPELIAEVRSPSDRWVEVLAKVNEYLQAGVNVVVVLDPAAWAATVFRPDELPQVIHNGDALTIPDILPGFSVTLSQLFRDLPR